MNRKRIVLYPVVAILHLAIFCSLGFAAHPLITDDTGVQGKGKFQIEVNGETGTDKQTIAGATEKTSASQAATTITYGATDHLDIVVTAPYQWIRVKQDGTTVSSESGMADVTIEAKWRFFDKDGLSFALKPGISLPTGDEQKGLGSGKSAYSLFCIATKEAEPWAFHGNIGIIRNENDPQWVDEEKNLWHASVAAEFAATKSLRIVGNVGMEKNPEKGASDNPAFGILGVIYSLTPDFEIDAGVKQGLTDPEMDTTLLAGVTFRF